jgi:hypothetical protein
MGHNLTLPRSPLLGRGDTLAQVQQLLLQEDVGLLTFTGPGGIGKTRLALQVAANLLDHFVDGAYFVALAGLVDPNLVLPAIAQVLGVREMPTQPLAASLQEYLCYRQLLLVLDNFEQLLPAPGLTRPAIAELLAACPRLKLLVTTPPLWRTRVSRTPAGAAPCRRPRQAGVRRPGRRCCHRPAPLCCCGPLLPPRSRRSAWFCAHTCQRIGGGPNLYRSRRAAAGDRAGRRPPQAPWGGYLGRAAAGTLGPADQRPPRPTAPPAHIARRDRLEL